LLASKENFQLARFQQKILKCVIHHDAKSHMTTPYYNVYINLRNSEF